MAFTKITTSELNSRGATTLPNQPKISATALKQEFDAPAKEVVAPKFNNLIDELEGTSAAASIGALAPAGRTGDTVQAVINKLSVDLKTVEDGMSEAIAEAHSHPNKELLDTYTQTEEDIAQAIADDHTHANKELLDSYTQSDEDITDAISAMHTHENKDLLDTYTQTDEDLADAVANSHAHSNKSVLDKFDEEDGEPTYDGNPIGGGSGDMLASDYDPNDTVKNAGGIVDYVDSQAYELPTAAADTKGGIKVGTNLSVDANGVMSATDTTYSDATTSESGLMSATDKAKLNGIEANANNYSLPTASTSTLGGVKVDGTSVTIDANGVISAQGGSGAADAYKTVKVGASNIVASGEDTLELVAGSNVTLTPDTSLKKVTISASGGGGSTGDMLAADYDSDFDVKTAGGIKSYVAGLDYVAKSSTAGLLKNDGSVDQTQYVSDISGKADKVSSATNGNFAGLDSNGNLTDSGKSSSDFLPSNTPIPDEVTANPVGTATGTLTKLGIGRDIYDIQGGGGIDGSTATPTDVVATWLECAGLHQSYTTLNEVLADSAVLSALMASTNAVDYLVRSTTWASAICADELAMNYIGENNYCANVLLADSTWGAAICNSAYFEEVLTGLVPAMTSNTTPRGVVTATNYDTGYEPWKAFDGNNNTFWYYSLTSGSSISASITYDFGSDTKINKAYIKAERSTGVDKNYTFRVQGSADGVNYSNLTEDTTIVLGATDISKEVQIIIPTPSMYRYYRVLTSSNFKAIAVIRTVQFYGRSDLPPVDDRINAKADKTDIAYVENGTTASKAYAIGQQFYLNGSLYKAKAAIAQEDTFTIGTNCELADCITDQIKALWDAINS